MLSHTTSESSTQLVEEQSTNLMHGRSVNLRAVFTSMTPIMTQVPSSPNLRPRYHSKVRREHLHHEEACRSRLRRHSAGEDLIAVAARSHSNVSYPIQCWIPVLEGLLPDSDQNKILLDLAFDMATWHSYGKLHMHTTHTINSFWMQTKELGSQLRRYVNKVCSKHKTKRLPGEAAASYCRQAAKVKKATSTPQQPNPPSTGSKVRKDPNLKFFNLATYKIHSLGDYADHIERFGTTDCFTTQQVRSFLLGIPLPHHNYPPNRANLSIGGSRNSTSAPTRCRGCMRGLTVVGPEE